MSQEVISVTGNEILFDALSAKVTLINKNAFLTVEFQVYSEHPHNLPYSPSDDLQKRIIDLVNTGNGISSINGVKVLTELVNDKTKFTVEVPIASKVPNSGSLISLVEMFKEQMEVQANKKS